jgi:hypothetical protein
VHKRPCRRCRRHREGKQGTGDDTKASLFALSPSSLRYVVRPKTAGRITCITWQYQRIMLPCVQPYCTSKANTKRITKGVTFTLVLYDKKTTCLKKYLPLHTPTLPLPCCANATAAAVLTPPPPPPPH